MISIPVVIVGTALVTVLVFGRRYIRKKKEKRQKMREARSMLINEFDTSGEPSSELKGIPLVIRYYSPVRPLKGSWIPVRYLTRDARESAGPYFVGYQAYTISQEEVGLLVAQGEIVAIHPTAISLDQRLWLSPFSELIVASKENPEQDRSAVRVGMMSPS